MFNRPDPYRTPEDRYAVAPYTGAVASAQVVPVAEHVPVPMQTIDISGQLHVVTPTGVYPVGSTKRQWTKNPWVIVPAGIAAVCAVSVLVIVMFIALHAVVTAAMANALAIGIMFIVVIVVALMFILAVAKLRHGSAGSSRRHYY